MEITETIASQGFVPIINYQLLIVNYLHAFIWHTLNSLAKFRLGFLFLFVLKQKKRIG